MLLQQPIDLYIHNYSIKAFKGTLMVIHSSSSNPKNIMRSSHEVSHCL